VVVPCAAGPRPVSHELICRGLIIQSGATGNLNHWAEHGLAGGKELCERNGTGFPNAPCIPTGDRFARLGVCYVTAVLTDVAGVKWRRDITFIDAKRSGRSRRAERTGACRYFHL